MNLRKFLNDYQKEWIDNKRISIVKNDEGSIFIVAMMVLLVLTIIGISSINTSNIELKISKNEALYKIAFFAADAGIEAGRAILNDLKKADSGSWDNLLAGNSFTWDNTLVSDLNAILDLYGGRNVDLATFSLSIKDNVDLDSNPLVDTDNTIILTSTTDYNGANVVIETVVNYLGNDVYAQEHYDSSSSGQAGDQSAAATNNVRW